MVSHRRAGLDRGYARIGLIRAELGNGFSGNATRDQKARMAGQKLGLAEAADVR